MNLELIDTNPIGHTEDEEEIGTNKIGRWIRRAMESKSYKELKQEKWQGKFLKQRWDDENLDNDCFQWMTEWKTASTHTIAGFQELYQQLLPTKVYHQSKTGINTTTDVTCWMCGKVPETVSRTCYDRLQCPCTNQISSKTQCSTQNLVFRATSTLVFAQRTRPDNRE